MTETLKKRVRCAVYTRKSTDEGLDQEYNSLEAQRDAGLAFIASQRHEGWIAVGDGYDDGGYSGGNMDRPALRRLMVDIEAGKIDTVVVYKIDRLTRSLPDFAKLVEVFDRNGVSFVSVTQQFNTTTSMGRLPSSNGASKRRASTPPSIRRCWPVCCSRPTGSACCTPSSRRRTDDSTATTFLTCTSGETRARACLPARRTWVICPPLNSRTRCWHKSTQRYRPLKY